MNIAVAQIQLCPHRLQRLQVQVHRARADGTAAGQRDHGMAIARQHRAKNKDRGPHLAHDVIISRVIADRMGGHGQHLAALQAGHLGPERLQQLGHGADIRQPRRIGQRQRFFRQQGGRHQREAGILCPRDGNHPVEFTPAPDKNRIHLPASFVIVAIRIIPRRSGPRLRLCLAPGHIGLQRGLQPIFACRFTSLRLAGGLLSGVTGPLGRGVRSAHGVLCISGEKTVQIALAQLREYR